MKRWAETNDEHHGNPQVGKYIGVYFAFGIGSSALVVVQTLILWIFCSIEVNAFIHHDILLLLTYSALKASRKLHERMAFAIFRSPMSFFETTPAGRILNRFSRYVSRIDRPVLSNMPLFLLHRLSGGDTIGKMSIRQRTCASHSARVEGRDSGASFPGKVLRFLLGIFRILPFSSFSDNDSIIPC